MKLEPEYIECKHGHEIMGHQLTRIWCTTLGELVGASSLLSTFTERASTPQAAPTRPVHTTLNKPTKQAPEALACAVFNCSSTALQCNRKPPLCEQHKRAAEVRLCENGPSVRYCGYCHRLHGVEHFVGTRRVCAQKAVLKSKNAAAKKHQP